MKNPPNNLNKDEKEDSTSITFSDILAAENRALIAQQEAIELRKKLEGLEELLAKTKENLASAQIRVEKKDQEIIKVQLEAHTLSKSVYGLEERFQRLKVLQNVLNEKRKQFGVEFCKKDSNSEASTSEATTTEPEATASEATASEVTKTEDTKTEDTKPEDTKTDVKEPDVKAPDVKAPDVKEPENVATEVKVTENTLTETKNLETQNLETVAEPKTAETISLENTNQNINLKDLKKEANIDAGDSNKVEKIKSTDSEIDSCKIESNKETN